MQEGIHFPHLGIHLEHVGQSINIFGFPIYFYGIVIGFGIMMGIVLAVAEAKRTGQNTENYFDLAIIGIITSISGARIYYVAFSWDTYKDDLLSILNPRGGGLAIYGAIIVAVLTVVIYCKIKKINTFQVFDTVAPSLLIGQIIGRWGNFFNREAFGDYTNGLLAMQLPVDAVRASEITDKMKEHIVKINDVSYIQVHPTFLYEGLWNLGVLIIILLYRKHKKYKGQLFLMYLFGYGAGRVWIEGLRTDQLLLPGIGWPVSQVLAGICVVVIGILMVVLGRKLAKS